MTSGQQFLAIKYASMLARLSAAAPMAAALPFSTISRVSNGEGWRGAGAGLTTDVGRTAGSLLGASALQSMSHRLPASPALRSVLLLSAALGGSALGQNQGRHLGESLFHPGNVMQRLKRSWQSV